MNTYQKNIRKIENKMRKLFPRTPLQYCDYLSKRYKANIYLKREDQTPVRSYKIRGAFHFISTLLKKNDPNTVILTCASAGNHAQGFALSCKHFKVSGTVFMPVTTPKQKIERTKDLGGKYIQIKLIGDTFDEASAAAQEFTKKTNAVFVPPFDHKKIVNAAATVSMEIMDELEDDLDAIVFPVGGGGLSSGNTLYLKEFSPKTEIFCAEPQGAPSLFTSLQNNKNTKLEKVDTFVDGGAVAKIGNLPFKILQENLKNEVILCPENRVAKTILECLHYTGIVLEPAGALATDALEDIFSNKSNAKKLKGKNIVVVASGGNFDFSRLPDLEERRLKYTGLKKYIILKLPQRPGALKEFLSLLGPNDDIARFEYLKKSSKTFGSVLIGIETNQQNNFKKLFKKLSSKGFAFEDITENELFFDFII